MKAVPTSEIVRRFRRWYAAAERHGQILPDSMALATVGGDGAPSVRFVLLKGADEDGFVFYTNERSRKGRDLADEPRAALAFHWNTTRRQVRIEGRVATVSEEEADAYWATRPRGSQLAALASSQSAPIAERRRLLAELERNKNAYRGRAVPRPPNWTGYRLVPHAIEFWAHREHRLHERELWTRRAGGWKSEILQP